MYKVARKKPRPVHRPSRFGNCSVEWFYRLECYCTVAAEMILSLANSTGRHTITKWCCLLAIGFTSLRTQH